MRTLPESRCELVEEDDRDCIVAVVFGDGEALFPDGSVRPEPVEGDLVWSFCAKTGVGPYESKSADPAKTCDECDRLSDNTYWRWLRGQS